MPYTTCTPKKSHHKVDVAQCHKCKGIKCYDYRDYIQPTLFPYYVQDETLRRPFRRKKAKPLPFWINQSS